MPMEDNARSQFDADTAQIAAARDIAHKMALAAQKLVAESDRRIELLSKVRDAKLNGTGITPSADADPPPPSQAELDGMKRALAVLEVP